MLTVIRTLVLCCCVYWAPLMALDTDQDTLSDNWEISRGLDPNTADYIVATGGYHSCGLASGVVQCWGQNTDGQTDVPGLTNPAALGLGLNHSCAVDDTGVVCWGNNGSNKATAPILNNPLAVTAGDDFSCGLDSNGITCWGSNWAGQRNVPVLNNPVAVSAGSYHACAIDSTGLVCWGYNGNGEATPPAVVNPLAVSAGKNHACALSASGVTCWGKNTFGQTNVPALSNPAAISAGDSFSCAVDDTGVVCWGVDDERLYPTTLQNPATVASGVAHACSLNELGFSCWGNSADGKLVSPIVFDPDGDGYSSALEIAEGADPLDDQSTPLDTDGDFIPDSIDDDDDGDGYDDTVESVEGSDPLDALSTPADNDNDFDPDSNDWDDDNDGLADTAEVSAGTDPFDSDSDNDGLDDGWEVIYGTDPLVFDAGADPDGDGLSNLQEYTLGTIPVVLVAGDLDVSFGGGKGWVSEGMDESIYESRGQSVVQLSSGKLIVLSEYYWNNDLQLLLSRFSRDGILDTSFGDRGHVGIQLDSALGFGGPPEWEVLEMGDGSIVGAGRNIVFKTNAEGVLDTSFGAGGIVQVTPGILFASAFLQDDGKIVAAGYDQSGADNDYAVVRFNSNDGSYDTSFDTDGIVTLDFGSGDDEAQSVIQQADGQLVVAGWAYNGADYDYGVVRLNPDGSLDTSFDTDGIVMTHIAAGGNGNDFGYSVIQQSDGKLVVAGYSRNGSWDDVSMARYLSDGSLDVSFSGDGLLMHAGTNGVAEQAFDVVQQVDGKLVVAGFYDAGSAENFFAMRFLADGNPDTDFDIDGTAIVDTLPGDEDFAHAVIQQDNNKLLLVGVKEDSGTDGLAMVRLNVDGSPDAAFGSNANGMVLENVRYSNYYSWSMIERSDGKLTLSTSGNRGYGLLQFTADGYLDTGFDADGKVLTNTTATGERTYSLIQQLDGQLVIAGYNGSSSNENFAVLRYNQDGSLDTSFSGDGLLVEDLANEDYAYRVIQQADGRLVAGGHCYDSSVAERDYCLIRTNSDGSLDMTFGSSGVLRTDFFGKNDWLYALLQQADGKLVAAGVSYSADNTQQFMSLARYNSDGSLDTGFDADGKVTLQVGNGESIVWDILQQADGKLVLAGWSDNGVDSDLTLVRLNSNGTLDTGFDVDGIATLDTGNYDYARSVIQLNDGKLLVAGKSTVNSSDDLLLVRFNLDGSIDSSFDGDGWRSYDFGYSEEVFELVELADGNFALGGKMRYSTMTRRQEALLVKIANGITDNDGDGMPNDWESYYGLDPDDGADAITDVDSDGLSNLDEYNLGLNPTNVDTDGDGYLDALDPSPSNSSIPGIDVNRSDWDADGDGDIVFQEAGTGSVVLWEMEDAGKQSATWLGNLSTANLLAYTDANGDRDADLVFQNGGSSAITLWRLQNGALQSSAQLGSQAGYTLSASGDIDNDDDGDLVFANGSGGFLVWLLEAGIKQSANWLGAWSGQSFAAMADVDGDGDTDIVTQDVSGNVNVIEMENGNKVAARWIGVWPGRTVVGAGDADNDGDDDIFMESTSPSGDVMVIEMENGLKVTGRWLGIWSGTEVLAVGDIDNDGDADLIQQNSGTGSVQVVEIENGAKVTGRWLGTFAYTLKGVIDADADGDVDVVLQDGSGNVALIELENGAKVGGAKWLGVNSGELKLF